LYGGWEDGTWSTHASKGKWNVRDMSKNPTAGLHARWYMELICQQGNWHVRANVEVSSNRASGMASSAAVLE